MARHYRLARSVWTAVEQSARSRRCSAAHEVMELLGLEPGAAVGQALDALEEEVEAGEIASADEARAFLRDWWGEMKDGDPLSADGDEGAGAPIAVSGTADARAARGRDRPPPAAARAFRGWSCVTSSSTTRR